MALFTQDLEFYHNKDRLTNYEQTGENFKRLFANTPDIRRELVPRTLEVYPIKDYGAIEVGAHRFCHKEEGKEERVFDSARSSDQALSIVIGESARFPNDTRCSLGQFSVAASARNPVLPLALAAEQALVRSQQ